MTHISDTLIYQRIRNRIIEVLDSFVGCEDEEAFDANELVNLWYDWVSDELINSFDDPVFTEQEVIEISSFHKQLNLVCDNTPLFMPTIEKLKSDSDWQNLIAGAKRALDIIMIRGCLSEDREII